MTDRPKPPLYVPLTSLDILSPASSGSPASSEQSQPGTTARYLEDLFVHLIDLVSDQQWNHPDLHRHMAPNYHAFVEHSPLPYVTTCEAFFEASRAIIRANPDYEVKVQNACAEVDEENSTAKLWASLRISGHPTGTVRESITVVTIRRRKNGDWVSSRQSGMRGVGIGLPWTEQTADYAEFDQG